MLPIVLNACVDDVANVRLAAASTIGQLVSRVDKATVGSKIKPALQKLAVVASINFSRFGKLDILLSFLQKDTDGDVLYFASQALKLCE